MRYRYEKIRKNFGRNLRRIREERGYSGRGLAREIGVGGHHASICLYETKGVFPRLPILLKICEVLEVTPNDLFGICNSKDLIDLMEEGI